MINKDSSLLMPNNYNYFQQKYNYRYRYCLYLLFITILTLNTCITIFTFIYIKHISDDISNKNTTDYVDKIEGMLNNVCKIFPEVC